MQNSRWLKETFDSVREPYQTLKKVFSMKASWFQFLRHENFDICRATWLGINGCFPKSYILECMPVQLRICTIETSLKITPVRITSSVNPFFELS